jgi:hypothetical protein
LLYPTAIAAKIEELAQTIQNEILVNTVIKKGCNRWSKKEKGQPPSICNRANVFNFFGSYFRPLCAILLDLPGETRFTVDINRFH